MKLIKRLICWWKGGHIYDLMKWRYNPHTDLWKQECLRCGKNKFTKEV